jgi:orotate phosphoribosyltransferase
MSERLIEILLERSVRHGTFTLASGKESDLYVDARQTTLSPEGALLIADLILQRLHPDAVGVGGPVTGADPITGAVALRSFQQGRPIHGFMVRKEPKGHGAGNQVEGRAGLPDGAKVCMIEDTVTTGGSLLKAIQAVEDAGLEVVQVICVVDRCEGAAERFADAGYTLEALVTRRDIT